MKPRQPSNTSRQSATLSSSSPKGRHKTSQSSSAENREARSGASQSKTRLGDRFGAYLIHHQITALESLMRLLKAPVQSLLTWMVVAIALALPAVLYIALGNIQGVGQGWQESSQISVFIHPRARENAVQALSERLLTKPEIGSVLYVSPEQALSEFKQYSGLGQVLESLDENPLPAVLLIQPAVAGEATIGLASASAAQLQALQAELQADPIVDDVRVDLQWVRRLHELMALGQRLVMALGGLLALGVLLVVGNTIRLSIESRRDEIVIVKLVGGTNAFVRRPFLYTGIWFGLGGGLLAVILLGFGISWLAPPVARLADLYQSDFQLQGLDWTEGLQLIGGAALLGWLGAWIAVGRHLGQIEPR